MSAKGTLRSGELARLAGVSTDTLRHYERKGVLAKPRRGANGYRAYGPEAVERVRLVRRALAVGFTLDELARILKERETGRAPCRTVRELAAAKLAEVEERLGEMRAVRDELRATLQDWDERLARAHAGAPARLLEALATDGGAPKPKAAIPAWTRKKKRRNDEADDNSSGSHAAGGRLRGDG